MLINLLSFGAQQHVQNADIFDEQIAPDESCSIVNWERGRLDQADCTALTDARAFIVPADDQIDDVDIDNDNANIRRVTSKKPAVLLYVSRRTMTDAVIILLEVKRRSIA